MEETHARSHGCHCPPPRPSPRISQASVALTQLWLALPSSSREQALRVLRRVVAQQLPWPPIGKEVLHDQP
jgi:hypothetical protein